jgi:hypothetical protein
VLSEKNGQKRVAKILVLLPAPISIRQDIEFAFSKWISYAYLGCYPYHEPFYPRRSAMKLSKADKTCIDYHKTHSKKMQCGLILAKDIILKSIRK